MHFLKKIFKAGAPKTECPRCLGKGFVNWQDIKRLKNELKWLPGSCAYCNGTGKVKPETLKKVPVDISYLTTDLPANESIKIFRGESNAFDRAKQYDTEIEHVINEIKSLHLDKGFQIDEIVNYYLSKFPHLEKSSYKKEELADYIDRVIQANR